MKKLYLKITAWTIAWTFAVWILIRTLIRNLAPLVLSVTGDDVIAEILGQLQGAVIRTPVFFSVIFSAAAGVLIFRKNRKPPVYYVFSAFSAFVLFLISFALSLYFTEVNRVLLSDVMKVLYPLIRSGLLEGVL